MKAVDQILIDKLYSLRESTRKIERVFEIIVYPVLQNQELKKSIVKEFDKADELTRGGLVELNEEELEVVRKMTAIRRLPFDPEKRVYRYAEVPGFSTGMFRRHRYICP